MGKNKEVTLDWAAFQAMGNPKNAPEIEDENNEEAIIADAVVRIFLEKKQRGGKTAAVIKGLEDESDDRLTQYAKELKKLCGVGGSAKNGEIVIQGNNREKIRDYLVKQGYKNVKLAGG